MIFMNGQQKPKRRPLRQIRRGLAIITDYTIELFARGSAEYPKEQHKSLRTIVEEHKQKERF